MGRFETRDECEDIIKKYHGASIGEEGMLMQVRYADTPAQKELKRITAERRQFRTNEYNIGAYGTADVGIHPSIYSPAPWSRRIPTDRYVFMSTRLSLETNCHLASLHPALPSVPTLAVARAWVLWCLRALDIPPSMTSTSLLGRFPSIPTNIVFRQSLSVPGTASSDDGLGGDSATVVDSPTVKKGSTQSSPTVKTEKA